MLDAPCFLATPSLPKQVVHVVHHEHTVDAVSIIHARIEHRNQKGEDALCEQLHERGMETRFKLDQASSKNRRGLLTNVLACSTLWEFS